jgi:repressor LexA
MLLGDIIYKYRTENDLSLRAFANKCGLSYTYISMLEKNKDYRTGKPIAPTLESVKYIANAMNLSIDELLKIIDDEQEFKMNEEAPKYNEPKYYMCPVYGQISAGQPNWAEECIEGRLPIDPNLMNIIDPGECYFLRVNGESMNKVIRNGAYALIRKTDWVENGEIAVVLVNGFDATLKKFSKQGDLVVLEPMSTDNSFQVQIYDKNTPIKIIGKYIGKFEMKN